VLCCAVLCCAVLCCAVLCCAVLCCAVLCCAVLCCAVLCCAVHLQAAAGSHRNNQQLQPNFATVAAALMAAMTNNMQYVAILSCCQSWCQCLTASLVSRLAETLGRQLPDQVQSICTWQAVLAGKLQECVPAYIKLTELCAAQRLGQFAHRQSVAALLLPPGVQDR
jgi:hypothetical protein